MKKIMTILGTRPEIVKLSPVIPLMNKEFKHIIVHTGQHYDYNMDELFFKDLNLRKPDYLLKIGSGSPIYQISEAMMKIEEIALKEKPDNILVFGDTNAPIAGSLVASKLGIFLIHLEAGCRCFNKIPEEVNRVTTDHCSDLLLAPDKKAFDNLTKEGISQSKIRIVGSTAIEASLRNAEYAEKSDALQKIGVKEGFYVIATIHRAENTNSPDRLKEIIDAINEIAKETTIVFPIHPRTRNSLKGYGIKLDGRIKAIEPQGYLDFLKLLKNCLFVMSDSGGIQEEAAALNIPCLILREETEWTYLTDIGKNLLIGTNKSNIVEKTKGLLKNKQKIKDIKNIKVNLKIKVSEDIIKEIKYENS